MRGNRSAPLFRFTGAAVTLFVTVLFLSGQNIISSTTDSTTEGSADKPDSIQIKKQKYTRPLSSRDIDVGITSKWPTTDISPLCEAWAHLDDLSTFEMDDESNKNDGLKWDYLDSLAQLSAERQAMIDSVLYKSDFNSGTWTIQDSMELAVQSAKDAFQHNDKSVNEMTGTDFVDYDTIHSRLLRYALSLRAHSPLCELHRSLARDVAIESGLYIPSLQLQSKTPATFAIIYPSGVVVDTVEDLSRAFHQHKENEMRTTTTTTTESDGNKQNMILLPGELPRPHSTGDAGTNDDVNNPTIILYTHVGTSMYTKFYNELRRLQANFLVRHMGAIDYEESNKTPKNENSLSGRKTMLQGYGIRLDIKNMEYRAYDDKFEGDDYKGSGDENKTDNVSYQRDEFLAGINLVKLTSRSTINTDDEHASSSLRSLQSQLQQSHERQHDMEEIIPPTWQTRILPLQAATVISSSQDPLLSLQDIAQNLPSRASSLIGVHVPQNIREAATAIHESPLISSGQLESIQSAPFGFFINGKRIFVERPSFNLFELLTTLSKEDIILANLESAFQFSSPAMYKALQKAFEMGDDLFRSIEPESSSKSPLRQQQQAGKLPDRIRIDVGRGGNKAIIYTNNIEKDPQYQNFMPSLNMLAYGYKQIRRNLFTFLIVLDPLSGNDVPALRFALYLLQSNMPVRVGILMVNGDDLESYSSTENGEWTGPTLPNLKTLDEPVTNAAFIEMFKLTQSKFGGHAALSFLFSFIDAFAKIKKNDELKNMTVQTLLAQYAQFFMAKGAQNFDELLDSVKSSWKSNDVSHSESYIESIRFASLKGLKDGMSFFNGIPLPIVSERDDDNKKNVMLFQERAMKVSTEESQHIAQLVMTGELTDR